MGSPRTASAALAMALAGAFAPAASSAPPPNGKASVPVLTGAVVRFEEKRGANVLYLEEKPGMGTPAAAAPAVPREPPPPRLRKGEKAAKRQP